MLHLRASLPCWVDLQIVMGISSITISAYYSVDEQLNVLRKPRHVKRSSSNNLSAAFMSFSPIDVLPTTTLLLVN